MQLKVCPRCGKHRLRILILWNQGRRVLKCLACGFLLSLALWAIAHDSFGDWERPPDTPAETLGHQGADFGNNPHLAVSGYGDTGVSGTTSYPGTIWQ